MAELLPNRSMPPGGVIPVLLYPDLAAAVAWLCAAFGFVERPRIAGHRSQLLIGEDAAMVAVQGDSPAAPCTEARTHTIMVRVADLDQHYARACRAGARIVQPS
jgi:uncharacterized glyoxalase superfamily protein PhnB